MIVKLIQNLETKMESQIKTSILWHSVLFLFILAVCGVLFIVEFSLLWNFLTVGGVGSVACQGFLIREACVGVLVGGAVFLLSGVQ